MKLTVQNLPEIKSSDPENQTSEKTEKINVRKIEVTHTTLHERRIQKEEMPENQPKQLKTKPKPKTAKGKQTKQTYPLLPVDIRKYCKNQNQRETQSGAEGGIVGDINNCSITLGKPDNNCDISNVRIEEGDLRPQI